MIATVGELLLYFSWIEGRLKMESWSFTFLGEGEIQIYY